jgi:Fe-S-cluster formation regulator IscX/YfhJ
MARFNPIHPADGAVPPEQVRFVDLHVEPWGDNTKIRVHMRLTPFSKPPNLGASIQDAAEEEVASALIIENIDYDLVFTLHIRPPTAPQPFKLMTQIFYDDLGVVDQRTLRFTLPVE